MGHPTILQLRAQNDFHLRSLALVWIVGHHPGAFISIVLSPRHRQLIWGHFSNPALFVLSTLEYRLWRFEGALHLSRQRFCSQAPRHNFAAPCRRCGRVWLVWWLEFGLFPSYPSIPALVLHHGSSLIAFITPSSSILLTFHLYFWCHLYFY